MAIYYDATGNKIRKSTGVEVKPKSGLPGQSVRTIAAHLEAKARIIAKEMESQAKGLPINQQIIEALGIDAERIHGGNHHSVSVEKFLGRFLESRQDNRGAWERDKKAVNQFLAFLGDRREITIRNVTRGIANDFMEAELERVSSGTVKRYLATLSCAFNKAVDQEIISMSPFKGVIPPKAARHDKQERKAFTPKEIQKMVKTFPDEWPDMIQVCLYTGGQRIGDIARLKWEQIDLQGGVLYMTTEKTKRRMSKPIIVPLRRVLDGRYSNRISEYVFPIAAMRHAQAGGKSSKLSLEFTGLLKEHGFIREKKRKEGQRRELSELSFHSLRASAVTVLRLSGVPADLCRFIVGHDSEDIERGYIRPQDEDIANAMEKLSEILSLD